MGRRSYKGPQSGGDTPTSSLENIFSSINTQYSNYAYKYVATPGTENTALFFLVEQTLNSTSKTLIYVSADGATLATTSFSGAYLLSFIAYDNSVLIVYRNSSTISSTNYYRKYTYANGSWSSTSQDSVSFKYCSSYSDNVYTYSGSKYATVRAQMYSMETICTFNLSGSTITQTRPSKRTWAQLLAVNSSNGNRRYFSGYSGTYTTEHQRNYKIYDSTNLSGNIETTLVGGDITYNTSYNTLLKRYYTSDSFCVFQVANFNANSQFTKYNFNSDYSDVSLGSKYITIPSNRNSSLFGVYQVFLESPTTMWYLNSSNAFEKLTIDLA